MTDRELIIDALRWYGASSEADSRESRNRLDRETYAERSIDALRVRAELEDNSDFVVRGGGRGGDRMSDERRVRFEVIGGPEGACLAVFDGNVGERIAGPKPWGGGNALYSWDVPVSDVLKALGVDAAQVPAA